MYGKLILIGVALLALAVPSFAVEGAVGRTLPGVWIMPEDGVVPSTPGFNFTIMPIGYLGSISGGRPVPIAGPIYTNVSPHLSENLVISQYVHKTETRKVRLFSRLDNEVGFDIYDRNPLINYSSGTVFHWNGMLLQYLFKKVGVDAIVSNVTQITNDTGPLAYVLHGFEGRAWGPDQ